MQEDVVDMPGLGGWIRSLWGIGRIRVRTVAPLEGADPAPFEYEQPSRQGNVEIFYYLHVNQPLVIARAEMGEDGKTSKGGLE